MDALYTLTFRRLRTIAAGLLRHERQGHTLQPTALVNEVFLKLRRMELEPTTQEHFFALSARAMKQVLIDHSRARQAQKKVPPPLLEALSDQPSTANMAELSLAVQQVFDQLRALDPDVSDCVWLRCVEGLSWEELSHTQSRAIWRVRSDYDFGISWMRTRLADRRRR